MTDTSLFVISRKRFDAVAAAHPRLAHALFAGLARALALRLRQADQAISTPRRGVSRATALTTRTMTWKL
ncbi:MAG: hypothetical protein U0235_00205 [Polyangiaceae bacterium]